MRYLATMIVLLCLVQAASAQAPPPSPISVNWGMLPDRGTYGDAITLMADPWPSLNPNPLPYSNGLPIAVKIPGNRTHFLARWASETGQTLEILVDTRTRPARYVKQ